MRALYYTCLASLVCLAIYTWIELTDSEVPVTNLSGMISYTPPENVPKKYLAFMDKKPVKKGTPTVLAEQDKIQIIECMLRKSDEKAHISAHSDIVSGSGKTLTVKILGKQVALENYVRPETSDDDGDGTEYIYSGVLQNTAYHKVEVEYMHDSPWMYLINPNNGSALLANAGEHTVRHLNDRILLINRGFTPPPLELC